MKKENFKLLAFAIYSACITGMNVLAAKQIDVLGFTVTTGILLSGLIFVVQDVMTEKFGIKESRKMIFYGYAIALIISLICQLAIVIPSSAYWSNQAAFATILSTTLRITIASIIAYALGSLSNTTIMSKLKEKYPKSLFVRCVSSTIVGQLLDNGLFALIAFYGVLPLNAILTMTIGGTIIETLTEIVCFPIVKLITKKIKD